MKVTPIAYTLFLSEVAREDTGGQWQTANDIEDDGSLFYTDSGQATAGNLVEFAGRQCYESWKRPNPETATNEGYLASIIDQGHLSVLEHGVVSFRITEVSRSFTHELVRHRHFSYSQLSQRFVVQGKVGEGPAFITPPLFENDPVAGQVLQDAWEHAMHAYDLLVGRANEYISTLHLSPTMAKKRAREAARAVLPNMTPTAIVVTGNHRAWREFFSKRMTTHADAEMFAVACMILDCLKDMEPNLYVDIDRPVATPLGAVVYE